MSHCLNCGKEPGPLMVVRGICRTCDMSWDWEWFMDVRVVDLDQNALGEWRAPRDGKMVVVAKSTEELRALIKRMPIGRDRAPCG